MKVKELVAAHDGVVTEMEEHFTLISELEAKTDRSEEDESKLVAAKAEYETLKGKADSMESRLDVAKDLAARRAASLAAADLGKSDPNGGGKTPLPGANADDPDADDVRGKALAAKAIDHAARERDKEKFFWSYASKGTYEDVPDKGREMMDPQFEGKKHNWDSAQGVLMPPKMRNLIFNGPEFVTADGKAFIDPLGLLRSKAVGDNPLLSTSADIPEALVPPEFQSELLQLPAEPPHLVDRVRRVPTKTGTLKWPRVVQTDGNEYGGVDVEWINEAGEKPEHNPKFDQVTIQTHELAARSELSRTLLNRSIIDLQAFLAAEFRGAILNAKDNAIIDGDGNGKPLGILKTPGIRRIARSTANKVIYDDLVDMECALRPQHRAAATWVMADTVMCQLRKEKDNEGRPLFVPNVRTGAFDSLFGKAIISTTRMDDNVATGRDDIFFGDLRQYITPIETDIVMFRSDHRKIENNIVVFVVFLLCGGRVVQERAFVELGDTSGS